LPVGAEGQKDKSGAAKTGAPAARPDIEMWMRNTEGLDIEKLNQHPLIQKIGELSGTNYKIVAPAKDGGDYETKLRLAFASGMYPAVFGTGGTGGIFSTGVDTLELIEAGIILPLDDLIAKNGKNITKYIPQSAFKEVRYQGKTYGLPELNQYGDHEDIAYVRKDWLDKLKIPMPKTLDEFYAMLVAFRDRDPSGNGVKDEIPLGARKKYSWMPIEGFFGKGKGASTWVMQDGKLIPGWASEQSKKSLAFERRLLEEGLLYKEALTDDSIKDKRDQGIVGVYTHQTQTAGLWNSQLEVPGGEWVAMPWFGAPGVTKFGYEKLPVRRNYLITKAAKDPAAVIRFFDWVLSDQGAELYNYGIEGRSHTKVGGKIVYDPTKDPDIELALGETIPKFRPYFLKPINRGRFTDAELNLVYGQEGRYLIDAIGVASKSGLDSYLTGMPDIPIFQEKPDLQDPYSNFRIKVIIGEKKPEEIDALFADWRQRGGDAAIEFVNAWYAKNK
jgi:putative aldouronate transport system substrate-binding protein